MLVLATSPDRPETGGQAIGADRRGPYRTMSASSDHGAVESNSSPVESPKAASTPPPSRFVQRHRSRRQPLVVQAAHAEIDTGDGDGVRLLQAFGQLENPEGVPFPPPELRIPLPAAVSGVNPQSEDINPTPADLGQSRADVGPPPPDGDPLRSHFDPSPLDFGATPHAPPTTRIPLAGNRPLGQVEINSHGDRVSLYARDAPISAVLGLLAKQHQLNLVSGADVVGVITVTLTDVPLEHALNAILRVNGYTWTQQNNILMVSPLGAVHVAPDVQGREFRVFPLNFVAAADVNAVVTGLLSPLGKSFISEANPLDKRRTREQIVVEDLPEYLARIESYICQIDHPPRQVLIESHILQVTLRDDTKHGVNFEQLLRIDDATLTLETTGFANPAASPAFFLTLDATDADVLVEALTLTTDAKTLASPKVLAVNGQDARIQIGEQLGFFVTTTTQTSTLQNVDFIDTGVVLHVTPIISDDHQVLMTVKPEVSTGRINPDTGLPEEETTEVETSILLADGEAMVIGGLIKEENSDLQSKIPYVGDLWLVGSLFQRRQHIRERNEIIIVLVPHIVPYTLPVHRREELHKTRAMTPLLEGPLREVDRRALEPELPDAHRHPWSWWKFNKRAARK